MATARIHLKPTDPARTSRVHTYELTGPLEELINQCVAAATGKAYPHLTSTRVIGTATDPWQSWESTDDRTGGLIATATVELV